MNSRSAGAGFTIIEVLIVLAVSSLIMVSALVLLGGKQQRTQFQQDINDLSSKIEDTVNGVASGFAPDVSNKIRCVMIGTTLKINKIGNGNTFDQGTQKGCVYVGKVIQFQPSTTDTAKLNIFTVVGLRTVDTGGTTLVQHFEDADLTVASPNSQTDNDLPDLTENYRLRWGTMITKAINLTDGSHPYAIGFFNGYGPDVSGISPASGTQNQISTTLTINPGASYDDIADDVNALTDATLTFPSKGVELCLDGGHGDYARLIIGGDNNQTGTKIVYDGRSRAPECN